MAAASGHHALLELLRPENPLLALILQSQQERIYFEINVEILPVRLFLRSRSPAHSSVETTPTSMGCQ